MNFERPERLGGNKPLCAGSIARKVSANNAFPFFGQMHIYSGAWGPRFSADRDASRPLLRRNNSDGSGWYTVGGGRHIHDGRREYIPADVFRPGNVPAGYAAVPQGVPLRTLHVLDILLVQNRRHGK